MGGGGGKGGIPAGGGSGAIFVRVNGGMVGLHMRMQSVWTMAYASFFVGIKG